MADWLNIEGDCSRDHQSGLRKLGWRENRCETISDSVSLQSDALERKGTTHLGENGRSEGLSMVS